MSRYRAPQKPGSKYITAEGHARLQQELDSLWRIERPRITQSVSEAAAQGDRSENAEYIYGKKRLREIDSRVRFLRKRLEGMTVVDQVPADPKKIYFGARVELEDEAGEVLNLRIVGPDEIDPQRQHISMDSPMARVLLGKQIDDEIEVETPGGHRHYVILTIDYREFEG